MSSEPYFAVDRIEPPGAAALIGVWRKARERLPAAKLYALIDSAFDESACAAYLNTRSIGCVMSLYEGSRFEELVSVSPWLVALEGDDAVRVSKETELLVTLRGTRPMLSLIAVECSLVELHEHFQDFLQVLVDGDSSFVLRFADTRVIDPLFDVFTPAQRVAFVPSNMALWFPRRQNNSIGGVLPDVSRLIAPASSPLHLDAKQFDDMLASAEADLILNSLTKTDPMRFAHSRPSDVYAFFQGQIKRARAHGVLDPANLEIYCTTAWVTGPEFDLQPDFAHAIRASSRAPGELASFLTTVPPLAWSHASQDRSRGGSV